MPFTRPCSSAEDLLGHRVPDHLDLRIGEESLLQDLRRAKRVAPMHDVHLLRVAREEVRFLDGRVAAADTAMTCPRKNAPSQMAQYDTPLPANSASPGMPSFTGVPPAVRITAGDRYHRRRR